MGVLGYALASWISTPVGGSWGRHWHHGLVPLWWPWGIIYNGITGQCHCGCPGVCIGIVGQYPCGVFGVCISMMDPHPYGGLGVCIGIMGQYPCGSVPLWWSCGIHWHHGSTSLSVFGVCIGIIGQYLCGVFGVYIVGVLGYALAPWVCTPVWGLGYAWVIMWRSWGMYWPLRANIACMHPHLCAGY